MLYHEQEERIDRDDLVQLQIERLQTTVHRAYRNVAFYRHAFDACDVDLERVRSLAALRELPLVTREDLARSYPYDMFSVPLREIVRIHTCPGPGSQPIVVGYTRNDVRHAAECAARLLAAADLTANDVVQIMFHHSLFAGGFGFDHGAELLGASVIPATAAANAEKQIVVMKDFKTTAIITTPAYGLRLAAALGGMGVHPERLAARVGLFSGEPWGDEVRGTLEDGLRIIAMDSYGISDVFGPGVAGECPARAGLHINEDHYLVEVLDPATREPVGAGERGELVVTTLTREGFPLIRYRTGDLSSLDTAPCPCGRTFARMAPVAGRTDDRIFAGGVSLFPAQIAEILRGVEGASPHFQILLDRVEGIDTLEVKVEVSEAMPALDEVKRLEVLRSALAARLETALDVTAKVTFVEPKSLRREGAAMPLVIDRRR